ncbi:hypothetical protein BKI49_17705 [Streptomyces sp. Tue6028]|uniref:hypothetical protein n=1 Tax=Streptomyces sp. Tue6028 TaxID=2036037 RepID=UPI000BB2F288|nr:hypothetical protein [Streptomyces sp. Tue6028]PBC62657.1 hypothetical protein BKI49_17705 [Streptomyces sp. Tue6028]
MFTRKSSALIAQAMCAGAVATVVVTATPASAQTIVPCSATALSAAIAAANGAQGGDLVLAPGCTYALTTPLPDITSTITVNARHSTLTRSSTASFGILSVASGGKLSISDATITNGDAPDFGGGIANRGVLHVTDSVFRDNHATYSGAIGGGSGSTTWIERTTIQRNTAKVNGGGVANDGNMTILNSRLIGNTAGAVSGNGVGGGVANDGTLNIVRSDINENHADRAGGVADIDGGTTTIKDTNVNANTADVAPGGVLSTPEPNNISGTVNLISSWVRNNRPTNCAGSNIAIAGCTN